MGPYRDGFVRILFRAAGKRPRWFWAQRVGQMTYRRVRPDGDREMASVIRADGTCVVTEEVLVGIPLEDRPARLNLFYGLLEDV